MRDYRVDLTDSQMQLLFNYVDRDQSGALDYDEFLRAIRGQMNQFRKNLVSRAFAKLDIDGSGQIDVDEIR